MNFLTDQDVYAVTTAYLRDAGHDVFTAYELGLAQADDAELLRVALEQDRIFVARDRDFGSLVFVQGSGPGVIYFTDIAFGSRRRAYRIAARRDQLQRTGTATFLIWPNP